MPKIRRRELPAAVIAHLVRRVRERQITPSQLKHFSDWMDANPTVPEGFWFKRFQGFAICGEGELIKTFLVAGQLPHGEEVQ
jgi:hypothetical protein